MKSRDADFSHMMGWFVAWVVAACALIVLSLSGFPGANALGKFVSDYQTLIAGFLATGAAVVTVHFLQRQIDVTRLQARDTFTIGLRRNRALAQKAILAANTMAQTKDLAEGALLTTEHGWQWFMNICQGYSEAVANDVFDRVEDEIGFPGGISVRFLRKHIRDYLQNKEQLFRFALIPDETVAMGLMMEWKGFMIMNEKYCRAVVEECDAFLYESYVILRRYQ